MAVSERGLIPVGKDVTRPAPTGVSTVSRSGAVSPWRAPRTAGDSPIDVPFEEDASSPKPPEENKRSWKEKFMAAKDNICALGKAIGSCAFIVGAALNAGHYWGGNDTSILLHHARQGAVVAIGGLVIAGASFLVGRLGKKKAAAAAPSFEEVVESPLRAEPPASETEEKWSLEDSIEIRGAKVSLYTSLEGEDGAQSPVKVGRIVVENGSPHKINLLYVTPGMGVRGFAKNSKGETVCRTAWKTLGPRRAASDVPSGDAGGGGIVLKFRGNGEKLYDDVSQQSMPFPMHSAERCALANVSVRFWDSPQEYTAKGRLFGDPEEEVIAGPSRTNGPTSKAAPARVFLPPTRA